MVNKVKGPSKRYGTRYGARNRERSARAEVQYKTRAKSPFCNKNSVKRIAAGIFFCRKTGKIFTGRAYSSQKSEVAK